MSTFLASHPRTHSAGELRAADVGKTVVLTGWVQGYRDHGGVVFIDLRDREGLTKLRFDPTFGKDAHALSGELRSEWCVGVVGEVRARGTVIDSKSGKERSLTNPNLKTGEIEIWATQLEVFSKSETPPFAIEDDIDTNDSLRLKYRYLDLRRPQMQKNLAMRSQITSTTRDYLGKNRFL